MTTYCSIKKNLVMPNHEVVERTISLYGNNAFLKTTVQSNFRRPNSGKWILADKQVSKLQCNCWIQNRKQLVQSQENRSRQQPLVVVSEWNIFSWTSIRPTSAYRQNGHRNTSLGPEIQLCPLELGAGDHRHGLRAFKRLLVIKYST